MQKASSISPFVPQLCCISWMLLGLIGLSLSITQPPGNLMKKAGLLRLLPSASLTSQ